MELEGCEVGYERHGVLIRAIKVLDSGTKLIIAQGSVVDFSGDAIVNAANTGGLMGGGVDGAISTAGGKALAEARRALPILDADDNFDPHSAPRVEGAGDRIRTGGAVTTVAGELSAKWVVHAVGPIYSAPPNWPKEDMLLRSAYVEAVKQAAQADCKSVGFSLLSSGIFRGGRPLVAVLAVGCKACEDAAADLESAAVLEEIYMVGYSEEQVDSLLKVVTMQDTVDCIVDEFMTVDSEGKLTEVDCIKLGSCMQGVPVTLDKLDDDIKYLIGLPATEAKFAMMELFDPPAMAAILSKYQEQQ